MLCKSPFSDCIYRVHFSNYFEKYPNNSLTNQRVQKGRVRYTIESGLLMNNQKAKYEWSFYSILLPNKQQSESIINR